MNNLRNRGVEDILIAVVDGLKGFPPSHRLQANDCRAVDAINAAFPDTTVQTCIVHLVRHSLNFCGWKDRKAVAKDLRRVYQAVDDEEAAKALDDFEAEWGRNTRQSRQAGGAHGKRSSRSLPSRPQCAKSSTPPTP